MFRNTQKAFYKVVTKHPQKAMVKYQIEVLLFNGIMDGAFYSEIIFFKNANTIMGRRWIFQQDNNPNIRPGKPRNFFLNDDCWIGHQIAQTSIPLRIY
jgi:hypothetical protein